MSHCTSLTVSQRRPAFSTHTLNKAGGKKKKIVRFSFNLYEVRQRLQLEQVVMKGVQFSFPSAMWDI